MHERRRSSSPTQTGHLRVHARLLLGGAEALQRAGADFNQPAQQRPAHLPEEPET